MFLDNKKVVIFDLDGTLIDSIGIWNEIDIELIKKIGNGIIDDIDMANQRNEKLKEFSKNQDAYLNYCGFLGEKYGSTLKKEEIKKLRYEIANEFLRDKIDYKPYAENVIKSLKEIEQKAKSVGYEIETEEYDFEDLYQIIIKIEK